MGSFSLFSDPDGRVLGSGNKTRLLADKARLRNKEVGMLANKDAIATIGVKDTEVARKFYEGKLGLKQEPSEEAGVLAYKSGNSVILVYESKFAGTNKAT